MKRITNVLRILLLTVQIIFALLMVIDITSSSYFLPIVNILLSSLGIFVSSISVMRQFENPKEKRLVFTIFGVSIGAIILSLFTIVVKFIITMT